MLEIGFGNFSSSEITVRWEAEDGSETAKDNYFTILEGKEGERGLCRINVRWDNGNEIEILLPVVYI